MPPKVITKESLHRERPIINFKGLNLTEHMRQSEIPGIIAEFIGTGSVAQAFFERQRYEVDAGRDVEPLLYTSLYNVIEDPTLPELIPVNVFGPAGVTFEEVTEGNSVNFITMGESDYSVRIRQYGVGLEYTKRMQVFNQVWSLAPIERRVGVAHNALLNHIHLGPIIAYSYPSSNQTAGSSVGDSLVEKYLRTIEDAITNAQEDTTNPRNGPYTLLIAPSARFMVERALNIVPQQGFSLQSSAGDTITQVIVYNGGTMTRGKETTTYAGVPSGKAYLCSTGFREEDFQSWVKQPLQSESGNPDVARFIRERTVWDVMLGMYVNPLRAVEEITWPVS